MLIQELEYVDPIKLYNVLREEGDFPFILESASKHERKARYTYLSVNPKFIVEIDGKGTKVDGKKVSDETNPFKALKNLFEVKLDGERFVGGFVGYIAYDAVHSYIEGTIDEPSVFGYYEDVFIYDHILNRFYFLSQEKSLEKVKFAENIINKAKRSEIEEEEGGSEILRCDADKDDFIEMVLKAKDYIFAGDAFQIVLSREYEIKTDLSPFQIYRNIRAINPSPYMFLLEFEKDLVGASPETMASVEGNIVKINPIAGTAPRGRNDEEDRKIAEKLLLDVKEVSEHVMLVDLARNDVRKVSKAGTVKVTMFMDVIKYSHVQHIESEVIGELDENKTAFDAMEAAFPAGTLTGAPKIRAMEIIDELEKSKRKVYGGCVGYFSINGWADMAIAIRMAEIDKVCRVRAGAGIVADSNPEKEFLETENKMAAVLKALEVIG
ncbi:MAG TPA: anthranilate synthase component I [Archaeoglobus profundus]|nr:anthranilate synthase component I [Archaeoglobus profundus]